MQSNFKIATWNIKDFKRFDLNVLKKFTEKENPDVLFLQETKLTLIEANHCVDFFPGYKVHNTVLSGRSAGIMALVKENLVPSISMYESVSVLKGRVICLEFENVFIINTYALYPGGKEKLQKRLEEYDPEILKLLDNLKAEKAVIWCGDLNVAEDKDIHKDVSFRYCKALKDNFRTAKTGFFDAYLAIHPENDGYTFWSDRNPNSRMENIGWKLDYYMVDNRLKENVCSCEILQEWDQSDHRPITISLRFPHS